MFTIKVVVLGKIGAKTLTISENTTVREALKMAGASDDLINDTTMAWKLDSRNANISEFIPNGTVLLTGAAQIKGN